MSKKFPNEEKHSLTDQIRRSSRSVCVNIAEGYRKRVYPNPKHFKSKMTDSDGEYSETIVWLDFCRDYNYISAVEHEKLYSKYREVGKMLGTMIKNPKKFLLRN